MSWNNGDFDPYAPDAGDDGLSDEDRRNLQEAEALRRQRATQANGQPVPMPSDSTPTQAGVDEIYKPQYKTPRSNPLGMMAGRHSLTGMISGYFQQRHDDDVLANQMEEQKFKDSVYSARYRDTAERTKSLEGLRKQRELQASKPKYTGDFEILNVPGMERKDGEEEGAWEDRVAAARKRLGLAKDSKEPSTAAEVQALDWYAKNKSSSDPNVQAAVKIFEGMRKNQGPQFAPGSGHQVYTDADGTWNVDLAKNTKTKISDSTMQRPTGGKGNGNPPKVTDRLTTADVEKEAMKAGSSAYTNAIKNGSDPVAAAKASNDAAAQARSVGLPKTLGPNPDRFPTTPPPAASAASSAPASPAVPAAPAGRVIRQFSPSTGKTRTSTDGGRTWQVQ